MLKHQSNQAIWLITLIILLLSGVPLVHAVDTITTIAGDGTGGYAGDGKDAAKDGRVNQPLDIFADAKGNLYVADTANHVIRRLDSGNIITTIAGTGGQPGFSGDDGLATAALLNFPASVVVDSQGNILIADASNHVIRKIDGVTGKISTVAGQGGKPGYSGEGQAATTAQLNAPKGLALDGNGNLYVSDSGNQVIRKIESVNNTEATKRVITTIAGGSAVTDNLTDTPTVAATVAKLNSPQGIALDNTGSSLYIADMVNHRILKVTNLTDTDATKRLIAKVAGGGTSGLGDGGLAIAAQLNNPSDVTVDSQGNVYIADTNQQRIRKVDTAGIITTFAGTGEANYGGDGGAASSAKLNGPKGLAFDSQGNLYIADTANNRLRKVTHTDDTSGQNFALTINLAGTGKGTVTAPVGLGTGINCTNVSTTSTTATSLSSCTDNYTNNTTVALLATPETGASFTGWSGECSGTTVSLIVTMTAAKTCTATFEIVAQPSSLSLVEAKKNNVEGVTGLQGVTSVAVSSDGQFVYATGYFDNAVAVFSREAATGQLSFVQIIQDGINNVKNLQGANAVAVSPDNKNVYVTGSKNNAIVVLNRDLTLVQFQENGIGGVSGLDGVSAVAVSADGLRVYVTGTRENALAVFARDPNSGLLTFLQVQKNGVNGMTGLGGATSVAVTHSATAPTDVYVASGVDNAITAFRRDPVGGELTLVGTYQNGVGNITGLSGVYGVTVSPDDLHVYAAMRGAIAAFTRDANTGALTFQSLYKGKASGISGFSGSPLAVSPDGSELYVTSVDDNALTIFGRDKTTGALVLKNSILNNTGSLDTLDGALGVAVSPDGQQVYTAALRSHAVSVFSGMAIDLAVTMTATPATVAINSVLTYSVTVTNQGQDAAPNVILTDTLPDKVVFNSVSPSQGTCDSPTADGKLVCRLGTLDKGQAVTVELKVTTATAVQGKQDKLLNKATVSTSQPDNNNTNDYAQVETVVMETVPQADLALTIATVPAADTVAVKSALTYVCTVTNNGPAVVNNTVLTNTLPTGVTFDAAASDSRCVASVGAAQESLVTCDLGTGNAQGTAEIKIQVTTPSTAASLTFTSSVKGDEADSILDNNQVTKTTTVVESVTTDLEVVDALADPDTLGVSSQQTIVYKVTVRNNGAIAADGVTLTSSAWPSKQVSYVSDTAGCTFNATSNLVCNLGTLATQETKTVNIQAKPLEPGLDIPVQFTVSSTASDPTTNNDAKTAILNISGQVANIVVSIADSSEGKAAAVNNPITYTITVNNNGPNAVAPSLAIDFALSKNDVLIEETKAADGTCQAGTTSASLTCTLNPLLPNGSSVVTVKVTPKGTGTLTVTATASVSSDVYDPTPANNTAKKETAIADTQADLGITLAATPQPVLKGNSLALEATITTAGPDQATGVYVDFTLPLSFTFKSAEGDNLAGTCTPISTATSVTSVGAATTSSTPIPSLEGMASVGAASVIKCPVNPLTTEQTTTLVRLIVTPTEGGKFDVSATVGSQVFDPVSTNNTSTVLKEDKSVQVEVTQSVVDLGITLTTAAEPIVGSPLTYTLDISNQGPNEATQVTITDTLPAAEQVLYKSATITPSSGSVCYDLNANRQLVCTLDNLPMGGAATLTIEVQPLQVGNLTNTAVLKSNEFDSDDKNNTATHTAYANNPDTLFFVEAQKSGTGKVTGLRGVISVAISPDSNHVYAVSFTDNALTVFSRNPSDGRLSFVQTLGDGQAGVEGLEAATDVALSPDGAYVYTTALNDSALSVFKRDTLSGQLTFVQMLKNGVAGVAGLGGAYALYVTASQVYVAASSDDAIAIFNRELTTGQLTFVEVMTDKSLDGVDAVAVSPDGLQLFAASANSDSLTLFNRDPNTGKLSLLQIFVNNNEGVQGLDAASGVVVSPDNKQVYVTSGGTDNAVAVFTRLSDQSTFRFVEVHRDGENGIDGLNGAAGVALSPDGNYVYVASTNDSAVAMFKRDTQSGNLTFLDVVRNSDKDLSGLGGARAVAVSPTGAHLYVAGFADNAVTLLRIASSDLKVSVSESKDPVNVAESFSYTVTVTNNGPNPATHVVLEDKLSPNLRLLQVPNNSPCSPTEEHKVVCQQNILDVGASLSVTLTVAANDTGEVTNEVVATADQFDPTPSVTSETTKVVATTDLAVTMLANPTIITVGTELTYHLTVSNKGPDPAKDIKLVDVLPKQVDFVSATGAANEDICQFSTITAEVTCTIASLKAGDQSLVTIVVIPKQDGMVTNSATVSSADFDSQLPNNTAELTVQVSLNIIDETYDNSQGELRDYIIAANGAVIGGNLAGTITNQGLISDAHILPETLIKNQCQSSDAENPNLSLAICGKLSGTITNDGIIEDAQLLSNATINGGVLRGNIVGFPAAPATINSKIEAGTTLSNVIIAVGSEVSPQAILGEGVRFISNATIPLGMDLTNALPWILEPISQRKSVNLLTDILAFQSSDLASSETLLAALNALPDLKNNGLALMQDLNTGNVSLLMGEEMFILAPPSVIQATATEMPGVTLNTDGSVIFITDSRRRVTLQPSIQSPEAFLDALRELGLDKFTAAAADGNLTIAPTDQLYFVARPDWQTQLSSPFAPLGFESLPSPTIAGLPLFLLHFMDNDGVTRRQQYFYPAAAHPEELQRSLRGIPGATAINFYNNGTLAVKIGERTYTAMFDYVVTKGSRSRVTQLLIVPDKNGDGGSDIQIVYANGDQQLLFMQPSPPLVEAVQAIPDVQRGLYTVTEDVKGNLVLTQLLKRLQMRITNTTQVDESTPPSMTLYPDGSGLFVTDSGQQLRTQPLVQDFAALQTTVRNLGLAGVLEEGNGNLTLPVTTTTTYSARPSLESNVTWLTMPLGLQTVPTSLPGVVYVVFIFRDEMGNKRQQFIYPAAKEPENLYTFFIKAPGVTSVTLSNDGTLTVTGTGDYNFRGIFDYVVEARDIPTGGIQFTRLPDVNGDGVEDYSLTYGNGKRQVIYRLP